MPSRTGCTLGSREEAYIWSWEAGIHPGYTSLGTMVGRWVARLPPSCSSPTVKRVVGRLFLLLPNSETGGCERGLMSVMTACWVYEGVRVNVSNGSQRLREALFLVNIPVSLLGSCSALLCLMSERWAQGRLEASLLLFPFHCW